MSPFDPAGLKADLSKIEEQITVPDFWDDQEKAQKIMKEKKEGIILRFYTEKNVSPEGKTFYIHLKFNEFHFPCRHLPRDGDRQDIDRREQPKSSYF